MTSDEERDAYNEARAELPSCANCGHPYHAGECEYEPGDRWIEGTNCGGWVAMPPCGCRNFEAESLETILEREHPEEI